MIGQAIWNIINFLVFLFILIKFAGPVVRKMVAERHEAMLGSIREAETSRRAADEALAQTQGRLANVDSELAQLVEQAKQMAAQQGAAIAETAKADAERLRLQAKSEIERERNAAIAEIRQLLVQQAFERATSELQQSMTPERQRQLVRGMIQKVGDGSLALK